MAQTLRVQIGDRTHRLIVDEDNLTLTFVDWFAREVEAFDLASVVSKPERFTKHVAISRPGRPEFWENAGFEREVRLAEHYENGRDAIVWGGFFGDREEDVWWSAAERVLALVQASGEQEVPGGVRQEGEAWIAERAGVLLAKATVELDLRAKNGFAKLTAASDEVPSDLTREVARGLKARHGQVRLHWLAPALEVGSNLALFRSGCVYGGRLVNHRRIEQGYESVNVWTPA